MAACFRGLCGFILILSFGDTVWARTWRVTPTGTGDAPTIQAAIDSAQAGDSVVLAAGAYTWTNQGAIGHSMVRLKPGTTLVGEMGPESTILDAEDQGRVILCLNVGSAVLIEGLTVTRGKGMGTAVPYVSYTGGGILADAASNPRLSNCVIRGNRVPVSPYGGGISCYDATIQNCKILDNSGGLDSGGIGISSLGRLVISGSTIKGNHAFGDCCASGGGILAVEAEMSDCWIEGNSATANIGGDGGGAAIGRGTVTRCVFLNNVAAARIGLGYSSYGGGLKAGECTITDCIFIGNAAFGGGAPGAGGAIGKVTQSPLTVVGCTLIGNRANDGGPFPGVRAIGGIAAPVGNITRCIIAWSEGLAVNSTITTSCTNFYGNTLGDEFRGIEQGGNLSVDPEFCAVDPASSLNVALQEDSPCAPGRHPEGAACGRIGAAEVGCGAVSVEERTWGEIKALFR